MSTVVTNLILEAASGASYTTERYTRRAEPITYASEARRAPFSDQWFLIGDGKRETGPLEFDLHIRDTDLRKAEDELNEALEILEDIETIRWGPYKRAMLGLRAAVPIPVVGGYRLQVSAWPAGPEWADDLDQPAKI